MKRWSGCILVCALTAFLWLLGMTNRAAAQGGAVTVDCSATDPNSYPSINMAIYAIGNSGYVFINPDTACNEDVYISNASNLQIGPWWGRPAIKGTVQVLNSSNILLYGLDVTSSYGTGIGVSSSQNIMIDSCTSSGNAGGGIGIRAFSI